jgi:hypothetical protein
MAAKRKNKKSGSSGTIKAFAAAVAEVVSIEGILEAIEAPNLRQVALHAVRDLALGISESQHDISTALTEIQEGKGAGDESALKLPLSYKITWNLDESEVDTVLSWSVKKKCEASHRLSDPGQPELFEGS